MNTALPVRYSWIYYDKIMKRRRHHLLFIKLNNYYAAFLFFFILLTFHQMNRSRSILTEIQRCKPTIWKVYCINKQKIERRNGTGYFYFCIWLFVLFFEDVPCRLSFGDRWRCGRASASLRQTNFKRPGVQETLQALTRPWRKSTSFCIHTKRVMPTFRLQRYRRTKVVLIG